MSRYICKKRGVVSDLSESRREERETHVKAEEAMADGLSYVASEHGVGSRSVNRCFRSEHKLRANHVSDAV